MLPEIQRTLAAIDPGVPISEAGSLGARLDSQFVAVRAARTMLVTFGAPALVLSMIGYERRGTILQRERSEWWPFDSQSAAFGVRFLA